MTNIGMNWDVATAAMVIGLLTSVLPSSASNAATIEFRGLSSKHLATPLDNTDEHIVIEGEIVQGDFKKFKEAVKLAMEWKEELEPKSPENWIKISLNSPGGNVEEAMKIGRYIREMLGSTYVYGTAVVRKGLGGAAETLAMSDDDPYLKAVMIEDSSTDYSAYFTRCYSACVLVFAAGVEREARDNTDATHWDSERQEGSVEVIPVIGLHRAFFPAEVFAELPKAEAKARFGQLEEAVERYLLEMGSSRSLIDRMNATNSKQIDLVPSNEVGALFPSREPFYDEWVIAKCGKYLLSDDSDTKLRELRRLWLQSRSDKELYDFVPDGMTRKEVRELIKEGSGSNQKYLSCEGEARAAEQKGSLLR